MGLGGEGGGVLGVVPGGGARDLTGGRCCMSKLHIEAAASSVDKTCYSKHVQI